MQWETPVNMPGTRLAIGGDCDYLVALSATEDSEVHAVVLTRWPRHLTDRALLTFTLMLGAHVARNTIRFPFGRGPGRPGMRTDTEIEAMFALAQGYAEQYEAGLDLHGYPEWTRHRPGSPEFGVDDLLVLDPDALKAAQEKFRQGGA